jgi:formamidopyrimidine-DNA glycosylase
MAKERAAKTKCLDIARTGKELVFRMSNENAFSVHLMLKGSFHICAAEEAADLPARIVTFAFEDQSALTVSDPSKLCRLTLNPKASAAPDVLSDEFDQAYFLKKARAFAWLNVKAFLIDQSIMRGIGNAYADEILFRANISPEAYVGRIPPEALMELYRAIPAVLTEAIEMILKIAPDIIGGEERSFLKVHHPDKAATDEGDPILVKVVADKKTYYTARQRRFR